MAVNLYDRFKEKRVPADSVEDFCNKYHRRGAYHERGADYMAADLQSHIDDIRRNGYTIIPQGSSTTGYVVSYYPELIKEAE